MFEKKDVYRRGNAEFYRDEVSCLLHAAAAAAAADDDDDDDDDFCSIFYFNI